MSLEKINLIRQELLSLEAEAYLVGTKDEFLGEFVPEYRERLKWLSGFSGSNGYLLITERDAAFLTDGRYLQQAAAEIPEGIKIYDQALFNLPSFLQKYQVNNILALDGFCYSIRQINQLEQYGLEIISLNLIDKFWLREIKNSEFIEIHAEKYSGKSTYEKERELRNILPLNSNSKSAYLVTDPISICWFLNIRGRDVSNTPIIQSYLILQGDGAKVLFADLTAVDEEVRDYFSQNNITIRPVSTILEYLAASDDIVDLLCDAKLTNYAFKLLSKNIINIDDPIIIAKSQKNAIEIKNIEQAHLLDGIALTNFLHDLELENIATNELEAVRSLENYRRKNPKYIAASFDTIMGADANGAIIHYRVSEESNLSFSANSLVLLDSGGQYYEGTTDVTRVVALGDVSPEIKKAYSLVLKGHIALARAVFPKGTKGYQLDSLARQYLWQENMDYAHGTGHGVGMFLNVHEGPQSISKAAIPEDLKPGMIISNEPGYYKEGSFGIRIENLLRVIEKNDGYLGFVNLTLAPYSKKLIDIDLLTSEEISWLNNYHQELVNKFANKLENHVIAWIKAQMIE